MIRLLQRLETWRHARLGRQIILPTVLGTLFFLGVLGVAAFLLGERAVVEQVNVRNRQLALQVSGEVTGLFQSLIDAMRLQEHQLLQMGETEAAALALLALREHYPYSFQELRLFNAGGEQVLRLSGTPAVLEAFEPPAIVPVPAPVQEALSTRRITVSPVLFRPFDASPYLTLAVPLRRGDAYGLLVAEVDLRLLWTKVDGIRIDQGSVSIVDQTGLILAHPDRQRVGQVLDTAAIRPVFEGYAGVTRYVLNGTEYLAGYAPSSGVLPWGVIVEQQRSAALAPVRAIGTMAALITLISAIGVALLLADITRRVMQPLEALSRTVTAIAASGDLSHDLPHLRADEISALTSSFNQMIASLRAAQERLQRWSQSLEQRVAERTAQLEAANAELQREVKVRQRAEAEIKRMNSDLIVARDRALEANKAKSAFLANMSHELRTPLNAILGFTQLMRRDGTLPQEHRDNLAVINRSGEHLLGLINDVLEMSKIEAGRMALTETAFDLHRMLHSLVDMVRLRAEGKGLALIFEQMPGLPQYVQTDERKLRQVLINLLGNATKFTEQGSVRLRVWCSQEDAELAQLWFMVRDTGPGIAEAEIDGLFEAFTQTESGQKAQEGTGLGLALSQQFVRLMGGEIVVHSQEGVGSTFTFDVPVTLVDAAAAGADPQKTGIDQQSGRVTGLAPGQPSFRLLIVEDKWASRVLLRRMLEGVGFEVWEASNGEEAVAVWQGWSPHLIWMDMRMPVMDGYEATRRIKAANGQATIIIALTASAFEEERALVLAAGCDDFVRKPFREAEIFAKMAQHLGVRYLYDEEESSDGDGALHPSLTPAMLADLPATWRSQLSQVASTADLEETLRVIAHIEQEQPALATALANLAHNFRFDKIMELVT